MLEGWRQRRQVARAQQGDAAAFAELLRPELPRLYRAAFYLARDADEASDLAQEACVRAYQNLADFESGRALGPWLHRILRNLFLDRRKSAASRHEVRANEEDELGGAREAAASPAVPSSDSPLEVLLQREQSAALGEHVRALPVAFAEVLVFCDIQEMSYAEVSEVTGVPLGTVKSRLSRARLMLRERLLAEPELLAGQSRKSRGGAS